MDADEEYALRARKQRKMYSRWWQPSVEDYYSPFDPHFDADSDSDASDDEDDEEEIIATRGDFACMSTELLVRISGFLDLESLCRVSSLSRSLKRTFDAPVVWSDRIQATMLIPKSQLGNVKDMKHWFLYQMCIAPHRRAIKSMPEKDRLELEFEERLLFNKISYNSWALPLRLLHSPLQDNTTIFLMILQSALIFAKLEGHVDAWPWFSIFAPIWIFDVLAFICCVIWFYFLAKSLMPKDYAEICLSGWLKDVLEAVQLGHSWFDYMLFAIASALLFVIFPVLLTLQLDVFLGLYFIDNGGNGPSSNATFVGASLPSAFASSSLFSYRASWTGIFACPTVAALIVLRMLQKRFAFCRRNRRFYRLGIAFFLFILTSCAIIFATFAGLHLDKSSLLPSWWSWWHTAIPLWVAAGVGFVMIGGGFNLTQRTSWWRRLQNTPYSMTRAPLIGLMVIFVALLIHRAEMGSSLNKIDLSSTSSSSSGSTASLSSMSPSAALQSFAVPNMATSTSPSSIPSIADSIPPVVPSSEYPTSSQVVHGPHASSPYFYQQNDNSFMFPFSFLFGLEAVLVLYWVQDLVDFGGHKHYAVRKQFNFSLSDSSRQLESTDGLLDPQDILLQI